jgi:O-antigen ligase
MPEPMQGSRLSFAGRIAGLIAIGALQAYWFAQPVPVPAKALAAAVVILSMIRPAYGLLIFAGLSPISPAVATLCGGGVGLGSQLLEQFALGVGAGVLVRGWSTEGRTRIGAPALFVAVVAVASAAAMLPAATAPIARHFWDGLVLHQVANRQTALSLPTFEPLFAALVIAECAVLGWAVERMVRRDPQLATRLVLMALVGHAGAGLLNIQILLRLALNTGDALKALPGFLTTVRISAATDIHTAASALLLAGVAGIGLLPGPRARQAAVGLLLTVVSAGLWLTGSRVAIMLGIAAVLVAVAWGVFRGSKRSLLTVGASALLALALGGWLATRDQAYRYNTVVGSISARLVLTTAALQVAEQAPFFGVGVTKLYDASAAFIGPSGRAVSGYAKENAHNNFVQVLAEQGLVGLSGLLCLLGVVLTSAIRSQRSSPDPIRGAVLAAVLACIVTWFVGHPLLVPEFALVFWLYGGILAGLTPSPKSATVFRWLAWVPAALVLVTLPIRASALRDAAGLEHFGLGVSRLWQHDDTQRYREAGATFSVYLPSGDASVVLPMRRAPGSTDPIVIDVGISGRPLMTTTIEGDSWHDVSIAVPESVRRFELVDFWVRQPASNAQTPNVLLRIGKAAPR